MGNCAYGRKGKTEASLKDPRSFELVNVGTRDEPGALVACMEFRSRNGFGGMAKGQSVWSYTGDKQMLVDLVEGNSTSNSKAVLSKTSFGVNNNKLWNRLCSGKTLTDRTDFENEVSKKK